MTADAALGGGVAVALGLVALVSRGGPQGGLRLALLAAGLAGGDLLRTGAALNPMIDPAFFRQSAPVADALAAVRPSRIHTCEPTATAAYWRGRSLRPTRHEVYTFAVSRETLFPNYNLTARVPSALSVDTTSLVPVGRLPPAGSSCARLDAFAPLLREAGVTHVVSLDPLSSPLLTESAVAAPAAIAPATVHFYALAGALPRLSVEPAGAARLVSDDGDRLQIEADAPAPAVLVLRDGYAPGWTALLDGRAVPVREHRGRHRSIAIPAGRSIVAMRYRPPGWAPGLAIAGGTLLVLGLLARRERRRAA
jgi:hypothetical protein